MSFTPRPNTSTAAGREKRKAPMISAGDAEFPRDYHTLAAGGGRGARRFQDNTNGGFTSSSLDRRHNSVAAKSLEALNSIHKADIERQRDALMDLQKNKYTNSPGSLSQGTTAGRQVPATPQSLTLTRASVFFFYMQQLLQILVNTTYNKQHLSHWIHLHKNRNGWIILLLPIIPLRASRFPIPQSREIVLL